MKQYTFTPTESMSALQVANTLKVLLVSLIESLQGQPTVGTDKLEVGANIYNAMSNDMQSFFIETITESPGQNIAPTNLRVANTNAKAIFPSDSSSGIAG